MSPGWISQMRARTTFWHWAMPLTTARNTSGKDRFWAIETITWGKSAQCMTRDYENASETATTVRS
jgi:hypothetical protein